MKSNNLDVSYEWYLSKTNYVSTALFMKKVKDFLETRLQDTTAPQYTETVHDTRIRNGQSGTIKGAELAGQYAFDDLVPALRGFGVTAN